MANWRKTKRKGKITTTQNSSGKSSTSQRVVSSPNVNVNHRYTSRGTIVRKTYKSGGHRFYMFFSLLCLSKYIYDLHLHLVTILLSEKLRTYLMNSGLL